MVFEVKFKFLRKMIFDIICFCLLLFSIVSAVRKGFIGSLLNFIAFVVNFSFTIVCYFYLDKVLSSYIPNTILLGLANIFISIIIYLLLSFILNSVTSYIVEYLCSNTLLNRIFGFLFGLIKGILIVMALFSTIIVFQCADSKATNFKDIIRNAPSDKKTIESSKIFNTACCHLFYFLEDKIGKNQVDNILEKIPFFWIHL